jgi:hypothetical protein
MKKLLCIITLFLIGLLFTSGCSDEKKNSQPINYTNVDAGTLLQDLHTNAMNAKKEHNGKEYAILGRIANIDIDGKGFSVLPTKGDWNKTNIVCETTKKEQKDKLSKFKNGDLILVKGKISSLTEKAYIIKVSDFEIPTSMAVAGLSDSKRKENDSLKEHSGNFYESISGVHLGMKEEEVKTTIGSPSALLSEKETMKQFDDAYRKSWYYKPQGMLIQFENGKVCNIVLLKESTLRLDRSGLGNRNSIAEFKSKYPNAKGTGIMNIAKGEYLSRIIHVIYPSP